MTAGTYNLTIDQGSDFSTIFTVKTNSNGATAARDLRSWSARASMRPTLESETSYDFDCVIINPGLTGQIKMSLPYARSQNIPAGIYFYDLEIYKGTSNVERLMQGQIALTREVTR